MNTVKTRLAKELLSIAEKGYLPDSILRKGMQRMCRNRITDIRISDEITREKYIKDFIDDMNRADIAPSPYFANQQHYEIPHNFFELVLGSYKKYSCGYWDDDTHDITQAESRALKLTCQHADIQDGHKILELGCGWGSLTLWLAEKFPGSHVTAISNSSSQRLYILNKINDLGLTNIEVLTKDINHFRPTTNFDRIVSVEMFEHLRNYNEIFNRISQWLSKEGKFFMHIFCNELEPYLFVDRGPSDWMTRHFFSAGMMPSADLPLYFQDSLTLDNEWHWDGMHYERTANAWLDNLDRNRSDALPILAKTYGTENANKWFHRWRLFFMACAELFGMEQGSVWGVRHYRFNQK